MFIETSVNKIKVMTVSFENEITQREIPLFRGVVMNTAGKEHELFHNHEGDRLRYAYPLIQYKLRNKRPLLVCLDMGIESSYHFFRNHQEGVFLGKRPYDLIVKDIKYESFDLKLLNKTEHYFLNNWLPLNQSNFKSFIELDSDIEKMLFLEKMLVGNILSFAKGVKWFIQDKVEVRISKILNKRTILLKGQKRIAFNISFMSNVKIPDNISLGKNASIGYGTIKSIKSNFKSN